MKASGIITSTLRGVESLMLDTFRTEPFHNFGLLYGDEVAALLPGGTCSDKTLSFRSLARRQGYRVFLHSGYIEGEEKHRLARVHVNDRVFFADVGNGWPALQLYPADTEVSFRCFGIGFRTEIAASQLSIFCERHGHESLQFVVDLCPKPEDTIHAAIEQRFAPGVVYPFSNSVRFSLVVENRFLFLRGECLEIYSDESFEKVDGIGQAELPCVLFDYFGFDLRHVKW